MSVAEFANESLVDVTPGIQATTDGHTPFTAATVLEPVIVVCPQMVCFG